MGSFERLKAALSDRYTIERELGAGGMATVYLAGDLKHKRKVAVKVLRPELAAALGSERFLREITITANLNHPHILPLLDSGKADVETGGRADSTPTEFLYYVMPYVEGESLRDRLNHETQLPIDDALKITEQVASALDYAHRHDVIHRDIKPENILLHEGMALVADFGIALAVQAAVGERLTETGLSLGTPAYMSPEQVAGERDIDARSDVYSLACVLYEMLAGEPPFTGATAQVVLARHVTDPVPPITTARSSVSQQVANALSRALGKAPADRFESTRMFAEALRTEQPSQVMPSTQAANDDKSIVVLPFENLSPDPENEYFADGLTEEIITDLSQIRSLLVISRNSAMQLKGTNKDTKTIGGELGVRYVLQGTVRKASDQLRITAQLVDAETDAQLWANKFTGTFDDVFDLQESVSQSIVKTLAVRLSPAEQKKIGEHAGAGSVEAYDLYLLGRHHINRFTKESFQTAIEHFQNALVRQPDFAKAYAGLADSYMLLTQGSAEPPLEMFPKARAATLKALEIDSSLEEAHTSLGGIHLFFDSDFERAESEFRRAIELNRNHSQAHHWLAITLFARGRHDEALEAIERALALDPLSPYVNLNVGWIRYGARDYDGALAHMQSAIEANPKSPTVRMMLGTAYMAKRMYTEAVAEFETALELSHGEFLFAKWILGYTLARAGQTSHARSILTEMEDVARHKFVNPDYFAIIHIGLGEYDQAIDRLEQATETRTDWPVWFPLDPMIDPIRRHPRFVALLKRLGLLEHEDTPTQSEVSVDGHDNKSIVVLPFDNLSPDPDNAFFADGLTEEIIADLSKVKALRVISRTSAMVLKGSHKDVPTIARELNVCYVLEGSVRRAGNSLRITAQLIDAENDAHLWAEKYSGTLDDVFDLQEQLSRSIVDALRVTLTSDEDRRIAARPIANVRAHDIWLRARQYTLSLSKDGPERARQLVEEALAIAGDNALLHATLAWIHAVRYSSVVEDADAVLELAGHHGARALALDPHIAWSHFASSVVCIRRGDIQGFVRNAQRALEIERDSHTLAVLAIYLAHAGRIDSARHYADEAAVLDPLTWLTTFPRGYVDLMDGRAASALGEMRDVYDRLGRGEVWPTFELAYAALQAGDEEEAIRLFNDVASGDQPDYSDLSRLFVHALQGERREAIDVLDTTDLKVLAPRDGGFACMVGSCFARVGEADLALDWLDRGIEYGFTNHRFLGEYERLLTPFHGDPRFEALMERAREKEQALVV